MRTPIRASMTLLAVAGLAFSLTACGSKADTQSGSATSGEAAIAQTEPAPQSASVAEVYQSRFADGELTTEDVTVKVTDNAVLPVGAEGNEHGQHPLLVLHFDFIVHDTAPAGTVPRDFTKLFTLHQDGQLAEAADHNHHESLDIAAEPFQTASSWIAYELQDEQTTVRLVADGPLVTGAEPAGEEEFRFQ